MPAKPGTNEVLRDFAAVGVGVEELDDEGGDDDADQAVIPASSRRQPQPLQGEDREGPGAGDHAGREERDPEEQVEAERGADDLGDVARHRDHLGLDPEPDRGPPREALAAELGEVLAGRDPELRRLGLDQHRDQVGRQHHPEQQVAELGAAGDVGREVAGVDVGDGGDEGRAEKGPDPAQPLGLAGERPAGGRGDGRLTRQHVLDGRLDHRGRRRLHRSRASPGGGRRSGPGIGVPWGSWLGSPSFSAISELELLGDVVLEHLGLLVDPVVGHPQGLGEVGLDQAVVADHLERDLFPGRGQDDPLVEGVLDQADLVEPLQHRGRGRGGDAEAVGELAGQHRALALPRERVDRLRVVLDRLGVGGSPRARACRFLIHRKQVLTSLNNPTAGRS